MPITEAQRSAMKIYRENHLETIKEYQRNYRKKYYYENREKIIENQRLAYQLLKKLKEKTIEI
jgi:hypothetical protein